MFPVILNHLDDDDDDNLINEANNYDYSNYNETSPLNQDNLRCTFGQRLARRFSTNSSNRNQLIPGERIIEIKNESDDDDQQPQTSTEINEHTNLINDYRFQRYRPIRTQLDNQDQHSQVRMKRNYQILRSKKRFTFPICFFIGLYISFLLMSSFIFTMFEQKMADTNSYFILQKQLMLTLTIEQFELIENLIDQSIQIQKSGIDVMNILYDNKYLINQLNELKISTDLNNEQTTKIPFINSKLTIKNNDDDKFDLYNSNHVIRTRKTYNWDFQQALFYVVSIATTIGYGNLTPESDNGKIYTIIFGLIAIPYTTILFSIVVSKFSNGPLRRFKLRLLTKHFTEKSHESLRIIRFICFILTTIFLLIGIMGLPAALFSRMEKHWTYLDGFYFIFISITTTGLGDFVPEFFGSLHHWIYEISVIVFLYFGIIMIMLWLTLIKSVFRRTISIKLDEYDQTDEEDRHETVLEEQVLINYDYHQKNYINYECLEITIHKTPPKSSNRQDSFNNCNQQRKKVSTLNLNKLNVSPSSNTITNNSYHKSKQPTIKSSSLNLLSNSLSNVNLNCKCFGLDQICKICTKRNQKAAQSIGKHLTNNEKIIEPVNLKETLLKLRGDQMEIDNSAFGNYVRRKRK